MVNYLYQKKSNYIMKYLKKFETHEDYEEYVGGGGHDKTQR